MKRSLFYIFSVLLLVGSFSCQKEASFESSKNKAVGSLQSDVSSECLPKTLAGIYVAGKVLNDSNFLQVDIRVSTIGSYKISTDTVNGYYFSTSGNFATTGINTIKLKATGTPTVAGTNLFILTFDSTFCLVEVNVLPPGAGGAAAFTLSQGAGGACMDASPSGTYVKSVALTSANKVDVKVNVTSIGTYNISTTATNGMTFTGSGSFSTTGPQVITLSGAGTPVNTGSITIPVTAGSSSCSFVVAVLATPPTPLAGDYFPLTANSWWSYDDPDGVFVSGDSLTRLNINPGTINGNTYRIFQEQDETTPYDSSFYRKTGNDYLEIALADDYTSHTFDATTIGEILFLKEGLTTNQTWQSAEYTGTENGLALKLKYAFTCTDANATVTLNGKTFNNVYKVTMKPQVSLVGSPYVDDFVLWETWYAKGIGMVFLKLSIGSVPYSVTIKNWKVF